MTGFPYIITDDDYRILYCSDWSRVADVPQTWRRDGVWYSTFNHWYTPRPFSMQVGGR